jgi:hypothetical protein
MCLELIIDQSTATAVDRRRGRILVRGHFRNLGDLSHSFSASRVRYSLAGPAGETVRVCNDASDDTEDKTEVPPSRMTDFESELTAYGTPEIRIGPVYRLSAALPDGSDRVSVALTFLQACLGYQ